MKILIVAATRAELSGLCTAFELPEGNFLQTPGFDLLITGVGMTATAFALGQVLPGNYSLILNLGIAGCYDRDIALGSLLHITVDIFSELGAQNYEEFLTIEQLGFGQSTYTALFDTLPPAVAALPKVRGITVNQVHGHADSISRITSRLQPVTESMEGAAVFYCASRFGLRCLQIRSVSNYVEPRNRDAWKIGLAIKNLNDWTVHFLTKG